METDQCQKKKKKKEPEEKRDGDKEGEKALLIFVCVACLCHQHPVGTTDVQMMSCGKGIGWGGWSERSAGGRADRRSLGARERGMRGGRAGDCDNPSLPRSHAVIPFS